jgi:hypothetical protein
MATFMSKSIGGVMIVSGVLIAGASGLCSVLVLWESFQNRPQAGADQLDFSGLVPIFGGIPFLIGLALIWGGRKMVRTAQAKIDTEEQPPR